MKVKKIISMIVVLSFLVCLFPLTASASAISASEEVQGKCIKATKDSIVVSYKSKVLKMSKTVTVQMKNISNKSKQFKESYYKNHPVKLKLTYRSSGTQINPNSVSITVNTAKIMPIPPTPPVTISFEITSGQNDKLISLAKKSKRTVSQLIEDLTLNYINNQK